MPRRLRAIRREAPQVLGLQVVPVEIGSHRLDRAHRGQAALPRTGGVVLGDGAQRQPLQRVGLTERVAKPAEGGERSRGVITSQQHRTGCVGNGRLHERQI